MNPPKLKRESIKQRCPKCQQLAVIEVKHTRKMEDKTIREKRCSACDRKWSTVERV